MLKGLYFGYFYNNPKDISLKISYSKPMHNCSDYLLSSEYLYKTQNITSSKLIQKNLKYDSL